jgi:hypothetical protein
LYSSRSDSLSCLAKPSMHRLSAEECYGGVQTGETAGERASAAAGVRVVHLAKARIRLHIMLTTLCNTASLQHAFSETK